MQRQSSFGCTGKGLFLQERPCLGKIISNVKAYIWFDIQNLTRCDFICTAIHDNEINFETVQH